MIYLAWKASPAFVRRGFNSYSIRQIFKNSLFRGFTFGTYYVIVII